MARIATPVRAALLATVIAAGLGACASPPSIEPLLRSAENAMRDEQRLLDDDRVRHGQWFDQQRATLEAAYAADLAARPATELDRAWVRDGTAVYVAAREAMLRHELELQRQNDVRRRNLQLADMAVQQAVALMQQQDQLFERVPDVRRWLTEQAAASAFLAPAVTGTATSNTTNTGETR
ncbi:MAG: hypothetical protein GC159_14365 [Phycisphaera sp.]|nr:hypothetical protein [Phycisphaera sp.]